MALKFLKLLLALAALWGFNGSAAQAATYDHVAVIVGENSGYSQVMNNSYFANLASQYGTATQMYAIRHPSLPNYLAMTGGSTFGVTDDASPGTHRISGKSIFGQTSGRSLVESMSSNCKLSDASPYVVHHNPQAYFVDERTLCNSNNISYNAKTDGVPNLGSRFTFVVPNKCDDAHDACYGHSGRAQAIQQYADYVKAFLAKAMQTTQWQTQRTVIVVTFDEDDRNEGNHIYTVVVSNQRGHATLTTHATLYTLLGTIEDVLSVSRLRNAVGSGSISSLF